MQRLIVLLAAVCLLPTAFCFAQGGQATALRVDPATSVHRAALYGGSTPAAQIAACLAGVQTQGGGECDASGIRGSSTISVTPFTGITNPMRLKFAGTWLINANITVPLNVTLDFQDGAELAVADGYTLTIQGHMAGTPRFSGAGVRATGTLTVGGPISDGETVTIDGLTYRLKNVMSQAFDVQLDASNTLTLAHLRAAINASGTPGVEYYAGTTVNLDVESTASAATTLSARARIAGWYGTDFATTAIMANGAWGASSLAGHIVPVQFQSPYISEILPEWWGAVGDGATYDTAAIQSALTALRPSTTGRLRFAGGGMGGARYLVNDSLVFGAAAHITGAIAPVNPGYPGTTIQMADGINKDIFRSWNAQGRFEYNHGLIIENLRLEAGASSTGGNGIWFYQGGEITILRNLHIYGFAAAAGVRVEGGNASTTLDHVSVFRSKYGLWLKEAFGNVNTHLLSGDDNEQMVYLDNTTAGANLNLTLYDSKGETGLERHNPFILAHNLNAGRINLVGGTITSYSAKTISSYTDTTPIEVTVPAHGYSNGASIRVASSPGVVLDGRWPITWIDANTFTLDGSTASGACAASCGNTHLVKSIIRLTGGVGGRVKMEGVQNENYEYMLEDATVSPVFRIPSASVGAGVANGPPGSITYYDNGSMELGQLLIFDRATGQYLPGIGTGISKHTIRMGPNQLLNAPWELQKNDGTPIARWDGYGKLKILDALDDGAGNVTQFDIDLTARPDLNAGLSINAGASGQNRATRIWLLNQGVLKWQLLNDYDEDGTNEFNLVNGANSRVLKVLQSGAATFLNDLTVIGALSAGSLSFIDLSARDLTLTGNALINGTTVDADGWKTLRIDATATGSQARLILKAGHGGPDTYAATSVDFWGWNGAASARQWSWLNDYNQDGTNELNLMDAAGYRVLKILQSGAATFSNDLTVIGALSPLGAIGVPLDVGAVIRATSAAWSTPGSGAGLEMYFRSSDNESYITSYDRTASAFRPLNLGASSLIINISGSVHTGVSVYGTSCTVKRIDGGIVTDASCP